MIIAANLILNARTERQCESCHGYLGKEQLRLYGAADYSDKPYVIYVHPYACLGGGSPLEREEIRSKLPAKKIEAYEGGSKDESENTGS